MKKILLFDFDGVIHSYTSGWQGCGVAIDEPVAGIKKVIDDLKNTYSIYIYSSRCENINGINCIKNYCKEFNIYYDKICNTKPPAFLTIDDRCICFDGNPSSLVEKINNFKTWTTKNV